MAEHLRNELAREGFVFSPRIVTTFGKFVEDYCAEEEPVTSTALALIVEEQLRRLDLPRYSGVRQFPGFRAALARTIDEFSGAGGTAIHAAATDPDFEAVWSGVRAEVDRRGWRFRPQRLHRAAQQIAAGEVPAKIWVTGFFSFTPPELAVLKALGARSDLSITMTESPLGGPALEQLRRFADEERKLQARPDTADRALFSVPALDAESTEVARRILLEHEKGRPFRDMGVIVRSEHPEVPALRAAFERFGVPSRSYFAAPLRSDPAVRYLLALVDAALEGWDHEAALAALRMYGSPLEQWGDRFEYRVMEGLPSRGLDGLRDSAPDFAEPWFDKLAALSRWQNESAKPAVWAERFSCLEDLFRVPEIEDRVTHEHALLWRRQSAALEHFSAAAEEAAAVLDADTKIPCREFRSALDTALSMMTLRVPDRRRDVVHILDAVEARQWRLPVVFVCGLIEGQFPIYQSEDPILSDRVRRQLQSMNLPLRTSAERQQEEQFLFDVALTRGTEQVVVSYPQLNAKGEPNLASLLLDATKFRDAGPAQRVKPRPVRSRSDEPFAIIADETLQAEVAARFGTLSASRTETFLRCPYSFFARYTLRLNEPPAEPWDRLNALIQGTIGHAVFEVVFRDNVPVEQAFETVFRQKCEEAGVPDGYRTEAIRLELLHGIRQLIRDRRVARGGVESLFEQKFRVDAGGLVITGQIDRLDIDADRNAIIFDYKYRRRYRIDSTVRDNEEGKKVQSGLYLIGARSLGYTPAGMVYSGFRREASVNGWVLPGVRPELESTCSPQHLNEVIEKAREVTLTARSQIAAGHIRPKPDELRTCEFCSYSLICRFEVAAEEMAVDA
jgi:ATP-dependent helicase/DNAse subunit B